MRKKIDRMYCSPAFKKMIRKQAIEEDLDTISFTEKLASENINEDYHHKKKKNVKFNFKF